MKRLILALLLASCGGGGGGVTDSPKTPPGELPSIVQFPAFNQVRSDFIDLTEGLTSNPMKVASPVCVNNPPADWQIWLCSGAKALPTVYAVTNGFNRAADPHFAWIISLNNEYLETPGCNTGPPNQSLGPNEYPFELTADTALKLEVKHDTRPFCGKIPYMSATYIRGVQGDTQTRMLSWAELRNRTLEIDVDLNRTTNESAWFRVLTHYRDPRTGQRYFINKDYVMPDVLPDFLLNWNWPYLSSFQAPGAIIMIPARDPARSLANGSHRITIPLQEQGIQYFPTFSAVEPDLLGVEIAVELGPVINTNSVTIKNVAIR